MQWRVTTELDDGYRKGWLTVDEFVKNHPNKDEMGPFLNLIVHLGWGWGWGFYLL